VPYRSPTAESWESVETFVSLRLKIEMFKKEKSKVVAELSDEKWLWNLALLCDISHHVNDLNIKLQAQQRPISDMFWAVKGSEMKLKLFWKLQENVNVIFLPVICFIRIDQYVVPHQVSML
jgi:hypothetical protein